MKLDPGQRPAELMQRAALRQRAEVDRCESDVFEKLEDDPLGVLVGVRLPAR